MPHLSKEKCQMSETGEPIDKSKMRIGDILVYRGKVTQQQMSEAFRLQKETGLRLGEQLIAMELVTEDDMLECLCWQKDVDFTSLVGVDVSPQAYSCLTEDYIEQNLVLPLDVGGGVLTIAHNDPINLQFVIDETAHKANLKIKAYIATEQGIRDAIQKHKEKMREFAPLVDALKMESPDRANPLTDKIWDLEDASTPMVSFTHMIIRTALNRKATDIYIEFVEDRLKVRFRVDGEVQNLLKFPADFDKHKEKIIARIKMMANLDVSERRVPQDGKFRAELKRKFMDCRVNILPTVEGEKAVIRILAKDRLNVSLDKTGMSNYSLKVLTGLLAKPYGLILVTGPTGSGKTTTLYAALQHVWSPKKSVVTVEDPVEYEVPDYSQIQVNTDVGMSFASILRAVLRQAPDVILIGEIRDGETAKIACEAAMTGHLVLSTLHANDSSSSVMRLTEIGVDNFLVASVLLGAIAQRLTRKLCAKCKIKMALTPELVEFAARYKMKTQFVYQHKGCPACTGQGYVGRMGIHEILVNSPQISEVITRKGSPFDIVAEARKKGFITLKEDALLKVFQGLTDMDQVAKSAG